MVEWSDREAPPTRVVRLSHFIISVDEPTQGEDDAVGVDVVRLDEEPDQPDG